MPSAMVTFNGRITLPPNVLKQLGLKTGDKVDFVELESGRFAITPQAEAVVTPIPGSNVDPKDWIPRLDFSNAVD